MHVTLNMGCSDLLLAAPTERHAARYGMSCCRQTAEKPHLRGRLLERDLQKDYQKATMKQMGSILCTQQSMVIEMPCWHALLNSWRGMHVMLNMRCKTFLSWQLLNQRHTAGHAMR